jgi:hypothetical protein
VCTPSNAINWRHRYGVFLEGCCPSRSWTERPDRTDRWGVPQVQSDFQPIPSCWVRPRRLPRRVSGHLHLEREFLICFTPPRPRCGLGRCDGALHELGEGGWDGTEKSNPHHSGPPNQPHGSRASSIPVGCFLAATLPLSDLHLFTGQSKYTLESARSGSLLIRVILAGDRIMRASGSVLPSAHDLINFLSIGYR